MRVVCRTGALVKSKISCSFVRLVFDFDVVMTGEDCTAYFFRSGLVAATFWSGLLLHVVRLKVTPFGRTSRLPDDAIVRGVRVPLDCDSPAIHSLGSHSPFLCIFGCR